MISHAAKIYKLGSRWRLAHSPPMSLLLEPRALRSLPAAQAFSPVGSPSLGGGALPAVPCSLLFSSIVQMQSTRKSTDCQGIMSENIYFPTCLF
jgi:hypothetical protein